MRPIQVIPISKETELLLLKDRPNDERVELIHVRTKFDVNEDGILEDIVFLFEPFSRKVVYLEYAEFAPLYLQ